LFDDFLIASEGELPKKAIDYLDRRGYNKL